MRTVVRTTELKTATQREDLPSHARVLKQQLLWTHHTRPEALPVEGRKKEGRSITFFNVNERGHVTSIHLFVLRAPERVPPRLTRGCLVWLCFADVLGLAE